MFSYRQTNTLLSEAIELTSLVRFFYSVRFFGVLLVPFTFVVEHDRIVNEAGSLK